LKTLALCTGLLFALTLNAAPSARATLIGAHVKGGVPGSPLLICEYAGRHAKFEILAQNGSCAPYIDVE
jgi:hypothetical protein